MMRYFLQTIIGFLLVAIQSALFASAIAVNPLAVDLNVQNRYQDIQVHNVGNSTAYVKIEVERIDHPGQPDQTFTELNDNPYQIGLIVTPSKVVIPVGQTRIMRALYVGSPPTSDVIYRITIAPVSGDLIAMYSGQTKLSAGMQLIIAYGVTIYARPLILEPHITAVRKGTALSLTNTGNTSVLIASCKQCNAKNICLPVPSVAKRLYPGNHFEATLPEDAPLQCTEGVLQDQFVPFNVQ